MNLLETEISSNDMRENLNILHYALAELSNKKVFHASFSSECDECGNNIEEEDTMYFYGNKQKMCEGCRESMIGTIKHIQAKIKLALSQPSK